MKKTVLFAIVLTAALTACEVQSGITKKSLEEYNPSPTPERTATPVEVIDPADVVTVDTAAAAGPIINVNKPEEAKKVKCDKYNRVIINGEQKEVNIAGNCKQIMLNGDNNKVTVVGGVSELVFNGHDNTVEYVKYINGKKPLITDSGSGNTVTKVPPPPPPGK